MRARAAFSLIELTVVLAVAVVMTAMLLPVLGQVRENVSRVFCGSNERQVGLAIIMYARDNDDRLPSSSFLEWGEPQNLTAAHVGEIGATAGGMDADMDEEGWDGLGHLFAGGYCGAPECYYCPSHRGDVVLDEHEWSNPGSQPIFTNYHYSGDRDWTNARPRRLEDGDRLVLLTDSFRPFDTLNHQSGMNILRADGSVRWAEDGGDEDSFLSMLMSAATNPDEMQTAWGRLERAVDR